MISQAKLNRYEEKLDVLLDEIKKTNEGDDVYQVLTRLAQICLYSAQYYRYYLPEWFEDRNEKAIALVNEIMAEIEEENL